LIDFNNAVLRSFILIFLISVLSMFATYAVRTHVLNHAGAVSVGYETVSASDSLATAASRPEAELLLYDFHDLSSIGDKLRDSGLVFSQDELEWAAGILNTKRFRPGRYVMQGSTSFPRLLGRLLRGEEDPLNVTVHPGLTYERFYERVAGQFRFDPSALREVMTDSTYITEELGLSREQFFGRMLPNTYQMYWTSTPKQLISRLLSEFDRAVEPLLNDISAQNLSLNEIVTLASIIELEAIFNDEMPRIAGLYLNRMDRRMRLQADPTVSYALQQRGRLTTADYRFEHPYNTYRINGLPPGPITNPSISAIRAAVRPESHDYLYMVATPDGRHEFTRTYAEHRVEVRRWRQWLREQDLLRREMESAGAGK
jgi:UPF0755 protein